MYLTHSTEIEFIFDILNSNQLKSSSKTGNLNQGDGIYAKSKFVFLSLLNRFKPIIGEITLYFNTNAIIDKDFYIANSHSGNPDKLFSNKDYYKKYIKTDKTHAYKLKVLEKLYKDSYIHKDKDKQYYWINNQVAVDYPIDLDYLETIQLNQTDLTRRHKDKYLKLVKYIKKNLPNVKLVIVK